MPGYWQICEELHQEDVAWRRDGKTLEITFAGSFRHCAYSIRYSPSRGSASEVSSPGLLCLGPVGNRAWRRAAVRVDGRRHRPSGRASVDRARHALALLPPEQPHARWPIRHCRFRRRNRRDRDRDAKEHVDRRRQVPRAVRRPQDRPVYYRAAPQPRARTRARAATSSPSRQPAGRARSRGSSAARSARSTRTRPVVRRVRGTRMAARDRAA